MPTDAVDGEHEWLTALEAVTRLSATLGDSDRAKSVLLSRLQDGVLTGRADSICQEADLGKISLDDLEWGEYRTSTPHEGQIDKSFLRPNREPYESEAVPKDFFLRSDGWALDLDKCHWDHGLIVVTRPANIRTADRKNEGSSLLRIRRLVFGLELARSDVESIVPSPQTKSVALASTIKEIGSQGNASQTWANWVAELVLMQHNGDIDAKTKAADLVKKVGDQLAVKGISSPSRSRTHPVASAVIKALRDHGNLI